MKAFLTIGCCLMLGFSLLACSGSTIPSYVHTTNPPPPAPPSAPPGLTMGPLSGFLPGGTVGERYNWCFRNYWLTECWFIGATGGVQPYVFSWTAGAGSSLPPGLRLNSGVCNLVECDLGSITGTPTASGTYAFSVTAADSESPQKQVSANCIIIVAP